MHKCNYDFEEAMNLGSIYFHDGKAYWKNTILDSGGYKDGDYYDGFFNTIRTRIFYCPFCGESL